MKKKIASFVAPSTTTPPKIFVSKNEVSKIGKLKTIMFLGFKSGCLCKSKYDVNVQLYKYLSMFLSSKLVFTQSLPFVHNYPFHKY